MSPIAAPCEPRSESAQTFVKPEASPASKAVAVTVPTTSNSETGFRVQAELTPLLRAIYYKQRAVGNRLSRLRRLPVTINTLNARPTLHINMIAAMITVVIQISKKY